MTIELYTAHMNLCFHIVSGRVRVAVRLRPRNSEELEADSDFADCVELQPEVFLTSLSIDHIILESV